MRSSTDATPASSASTARPSRSPACPRRELIAAKRTARLDSRATVPARAPRFEVTSKQSRAARALVGRPPSAERRLAAALLASLLLACLCSCGSGGVIEPKIGAARTFKLAALRPAAPVAAGTATTISFTIQEPSGRPLTRFKRGAGPHTGIHLIIVREDLSVIIHRHPPIATDGSVRQRIVLPAPGPYRVLVDVYPNLPGGVPNFQLVGHLRATGGYRQAPLEPFRAERTVGGVRFSIARLPRLKAISPALLTVNVRTADGAPARFTPWYGALAHAIFFREGSLDYFHTHICAPNQAGCASIGGPTSITGSSTKPGVMHVGVLVPIAGTWRLFLQTKVDGHVLTAPFTLEVH